MASIILLLFLKTILEIVLKYITHPLYVAAYLVHGYRLPSEGIICLQICLLSDIINEAASFSNVFIFEIA